MPTQAAQNFALAQRECGRMWHAMRYARLNLIELKARRCVSRKDFAEALVMITTTREKYLQAQQRLFESHAVLWQGN
jgi:hypothetical protein